jgi:hypothetical protein
LPSPQKYEVCFEIDRFTTVLILSLLPFNDKNIIRIFSAFHQILTDYKFFYKFLIDKRVIFECESKVKKSSKKTLSPNYAKSRLFNAKSVSF